jgi:hypothetical protein
MSTVASSAFTMIVTISMQRESVVAIQIITYGIWFFFSKYGSARIKLDVNEIN